MTSPKHNVRYREPSDLPSCASLLARVYEKDRYPVQGVSHAVKFLSSPSTLAAWVATNQPSSTSINATPELQVVGHVSLTSPSPTDPAVALWYAQKHPEPIAVLERLFVDPDARGQGLAEQLIKAVGQEAEKRGLRAVLFALVKDAGAMRLYERVGWREFGRSMYSYRDSAGEQREIEAVSYVGPSGSFKR